MIPKSQSEKMGISGLNHKKKREDHKESNKIVKVVLVLGFDS